MRIRISHETTHRYAPPARMLIQNLRLTPHGFDSQYVLTWRIALDIDSALKTSEDAHGNVVEASNQYLHQWLSSDGQTLVQCNDPSCDPNGVIDPVRSS